jgi:PKD repeat protein
MAVSASSNRESRLKRFGASVATVALLASMLVLRAATAAGATSFVTTQGSSLMYQGQHIVLRGVNFNNEPALACCGGPDINAINAVQSDYAQAHALGVNHLRWGIDYNWYAANRTQFFSVLDQHMAWAAQNQLWVYLVDFIPPGGSSGGFDQSAANGYCIWSDCAGGAANQTLLNNMWQDIAQHYANNPTILGYDVMNEPAPPSDTQWATLATRLYNTLTAADPNHLVIIEAPLSNDLSLFNITSRVIYSVHHYPGGDNFPTGTPANTPMIVGEFGDQRTSSTAVTFVTSEISRYNAAGVSWTYFVWREDPQGFGLYVDPAGDFSQPWPAMISATSAGWAGNVLPAAPSPTPSPSSSPSPSATPSPSSTPTPTPPPTPSPSPSPSSSIPNYDHIVQIVMENHSYSEIVGNSAAPYINSLISRGALATNYVNPAHPSLPNYMELTAGQIGSCTDDFLTNQCSMPGVGLADRVEASGRTWKGYMESMGTACNLNPGGTYAAHHNPWIYFDDIRTNATRCNTHDVDYTSWATDRAGASTTPNYVWITPNLCDDMHDCSVGQGDTWLSQNVPAILSSPAFTTQHSLLILTWDEGSADDQITTIFMGYDVTAGTRSATSYDHYSLLKTIETAWSLPTMTVNDGAASPMVDMFGAAGGPAPLVASSSASQTAASAPATINFTGSASGGSAPYTWAWQFGDGGTSTAQSPSHTFTTAGSYTVNLTVRDGAGATAAATPIAISIGGALAASATALPTAGDAPLIVRLTGGANGGTSPYTFHWAFGDGTSASTQTASHTYAAAGSYTATLTVTDASSHTATATAAVVVSPALSATAAASPSGGDAPATIGFTGGSTGGLGPYAFSWSFGDGATSSTQSPSHTYTQAGQYTARLTVTDGNGTTATATVAVAIDAALGVSASASPAAGDAPLAVTFSASPVGGRLPLTYGWDFGDGGTGSGAAPTHTYAATGHYTAHLTVVDANGGTASATVAVTVNPLPAAAASARPATGDAPLAVTFTGSGTAGTPPYTYTWAFGDGGTAAGPAPTHTYTTAGAYTAVVTVTDASGHADMSSVAVTVNAPPSATATASTTAGNVPLTVGFTGTASAGTAPYTYAWTFGDGGTSTAQNPSHTYTVAGAYQAVLSVTDAAGGHTTATTSTITVTGPLAASAQASPLAGDAPLSVAFTGAPSGGAGGYTFAWAFGDGAASTAQSPTHLYGAAGTFTASFTVTDRVGATATATVTVVVAPSLAATATASATQGDAPLGVAFSGGVTGGLAPYTYSWSFGDGASSPAQNPSHTYGAAGSYHVVLTVTDANHVTVSATPITIAVTAPPTVFASASPRTGDSPMSVTFSVTTTGGLAPYAYAWDFGDGSRDTSAGPTHTYAAAGAYTASVSVTDATGVTATSTVGVTVNPPPGLATSADRTEGDAPLAVAFTATATAGTLPYGYAWDFGDGTVSTAANPVHTYTSSGTYAARLTVTDAAGRHAVASALTITVHPTLQATAAASVATGLAPLNVVFSATPAGGRAPYSYTWDFGDGATSSAQNPSHTFTTAGLYAASVIVSDASGSTVTAAAGSIRAYGPLSASAAASPATGDAPVNVRLTAIGSGGLPPYTYAWDLGDGTSSAVQDPNHSYGAAGTYQAAVVVTDASGATAHATTTITVYDALTVSSTVTPTSGQASLAVHMSATVAGGLAPYTVTWAFGDGTTSTGAGADHAYSAGVFDVTLTVRDAAGGSWTATVARVSATAPPQPTPPATGGGSHQTAPTPTSAPTEPPGATPTASPSPSSAPVEPSPSEPAETPVAAGQAGGGGLPNLLGTLLVVLGTLFGGGLGGGVYLAWRRRRLGG